MEMSVNCSLWQENSLSVKHFAFAKFFEVPGECFLLFTLILLMFLVSLTGNALIALAIFTSPALHTPMYFFLANLSLLEIGYTCSVIPKMLQSLVMSNISKYSLGKAGPTGQENRTFHDNETRLLLAAPIYFKRKMGIEEAPYGVG
ncbi:hypothetical protein U0070_015137 [Myodes glareolus]|uniref:Uncharacterized protein n=1 Tax=Myodes glareolus TaxID=447135 RepID=A0AAW0H6M3_MYOGA